jgi:hypothetical protein
MAVAMVLYWRLPGWLGQPPPWPRDHDLDALLGIRGQLKSAVFGQVDVAAAAMAMTVLLVLLRMVFRSELAAALGVVTILSLPEALGSTVPVWITLPSTMAISAIGIAVLMRFGLLAVMVMLYVGHRALASPFSLRFDHWSGAPTAFALAVIVAVVAWGLVASASRRRLAVVHDLAA